MTNLLFTIKQSSLGLCNFPFSAKNEINAKKMFVDFLAKNQVSSDLGLSQSFFDKDDFLLLKVGSFSDESAELTPISVELIELDSSDLEKYDEVYNFYEKKFKNENPVIRG